MFGTWPLLLSVARPRTWLGQTFMSSVLLVGVCFLAMPLQTIGANFMQVWEERQLIKLQALTRQLLAENGLAPDDCLTAFKQFDANGTGLIDAPEFSYVLTKILGLTLSQAELNRLWTFIDINRTGAVNFVEFHSALFPKSEVGDAPLGRVGRRVAACATRACRRDDGVRRARADAMTACDARAVLSPTRHVPRPCAVLAWHVDAVCGLFVPLPTLGP